MPKKIRNKTSKQETKPTLSPAYKEDPTGMRSLGMRFVRGAIGLLLIFGLVAGGGSYFMRHRVVELLRTRTITSSSVVFSRPFPISRGTSIEKSGFATRAKRIGYQLVSTLPSRPGQWSSNGRTVTIFLRKARVRGLEEQLEQLVQLSINEKGLVEDIEDYKFKRPISHVWLEPELLSILGNTSSRAVSPRRLSEFNPYLKDAILSIEDERFYSHFGIDPLAVSRAFITNLRSGRVVQGGSTITQQLAKNLFLDPQRTIIRKLREAFSAILLETAFSKDQILEYYMNEVFLGQEGRIAIHGFGEASRTFYDKEASELSLAEAATLAGLIKAPSRYSPRRFAKRAIKRRDIVIGKMLELKKIDHKEAEAALKERPHVQPAKRSRRQAPYFIDFVRKSVERISEAQKFNPGPLHVYSGIDLEFQLCAEQAVENGLAKLEKSHSRLKQSPSPVQAALVAVIPSSGEILAWVGGRDYGKNQFDRVSMAKRQPGSAFKPFVYLTAIDETLNNYRVARTTSLLSDDPLSLEIPGSTRWEPKNYDKKYRGEVTVRYALAKSLNIPTVNLALKVGIPYVARTASLFGFGDNLPEVPSLALGAGEVTPLEMARAYSGLANGGKLLNLRAMRMIASPESEEPLYEEMVIEERVASEPAVYVLTDILRSVIEQGTGHSVRRLGFSAPAAGKTGTSNDERDAWFAGYTPRILAVVWVGFDDNKALKLTGGSAAAPIWTEFMKCASAMEPRLDFVTPPGVVFRMVDLQTGLLDSGNCPKKDVVREVFVEGTEPVTPCPIHTPRERYGEAQPATRSAWPPKTPRSEKKRSFWEKVFGP